MSYDPKTIANEFLDLARASDKPLTTMKLQKLVYYAHGWNLALTGDPLINEMVEAWEWGPVVPTLYREFKKFGNQPIHGLASDLERQDGGFRIVHPRVPKTDQKGIFTRGLLERVWALYGKYSAYQLSRMTHERGGPWDQVWTPMKSDPILGTDIPNELIEKHFKSQLRNG